MEQEGQQQIDYYQQSRQRKRIFTKILYNRYSSGQVNDDKQQNSSTENSQIKTSNEEVQNDNHSNKTEEKYLSLLSESQILDIIQQFRQHNWRECHSLFKNLEKYDEINYQNAEIKIINNIGNGVEIQMFQSSEQLIFQQEIQKQDGNNFLENNVRSDASNIYIVVEKVNEKERPYLIKNFSQHIKIEIKDLNITLPAYKKRDNYRNPAGLFQNITTGVKNLLNKPTEGFVLGSLEGGLVFIQGNSSLIKNNIWQGPFIQRINLLAHFQVEYLLCKWQSKDEQYQKERDILRTKKLDGAVQGAISIYLDVANGIAGGFYKTFKRCLKRRSSSFDKRIYFQINQHIQGSAL
ncbi:hypothetical protein ABPG74_005063 [Tetrahymena malaccensis]